MGAVGARSIILTRRVPVSVRPLVRLSVAVRVAGTRQAPPAAVHRNHLRDRFNHLRHVRFSQTPGARHPVTLATSTLDAPTPLPSPPRVPDTMLHSTF